MTTRAQLIKQCRDILMDVIGLIEVKTDSDAGALSVNPLVELAMEGERMKVELAKCPYCGQKQMED